MSVRACAVPPSEATVVRSRAVRAGRRDRPLERLADEELLEQLARSDEGALAELYDRFGGVAYGLALRIVRDETLAQDAVQEAFLTVWRSAGTFVPARARPSTWILTLVHRRAVDIVRREQRRRGEPLDESLHGTGGAAAEEASLRFDRRIVQDALERLPAEQRDAVQLAYYGGLTQSEIAERLGEPLGTIKSRTFAGLTRLRQLLREAGIEEPVAG